MTNFQRILLIALTTIGASSALVPLFVKRQLRRKTTALVGGAVATGVMAAYLQKQQQKRADESLFTPEVGSLSGQTILITGGTTGLGLESAKRLAVGGPSQIIITARTHSKGQTAVHDVQDYLQEKMIENDCVVSYRLLDLDNLQGIKKAVDDWMESDFPEIDVMLNNAGVMAISERELTVDGVEKQMQSNHLGHFLLTSLLAPKLKSTARIIDVSTEAHKIARSGLDFEYMWKGEPNYGGWKSYGQSKLANIYFSQELSRRAESQGLGWQVACLHPGAVATDLGRYIIGMDNWERSKQGEESSFSIQKALMNTLTLFIKTVEQGATTHVYLAAGAAPEPWKGAYYVDCVPQRLSDVATDAAAARRLWEESEELTGIDFFESINPQPAVVPEVLE